MLTDRRIAEREMYQHSYEHKRRDPDNCAACALQSADPNYAGWPLLYITLGKPMNKEAFGRDLAEALQDNRLYFDNILAHLKEYGHPGYRKAGAR